ncbi:MAG: thioredoxin [Bacteroidales bacterium]|nr:thioredoxin [Bacteroidales bacterium]
METVITNTNIDQVLAGEGLLVIDFWATWCGPCRMLSPTIEDLAREYAGKPVTIAKCNVDDCEEGAVRFGVRNIPTVVFVKNGQVLDRSVGLVPKQTLVDKIESLI